MKFSKTIEFLTVISTIFKGLSEMLGEFNRFQYYQTVRRRSRRKRFVKIND